jgi:hypothetical protein
MKIGEDKTECEQKKEKAPCCKKLRTMIIGGVMVAGLFFLFKWMGI